MDDGGHHKRMVKELEDVSRSSGLGMYRVVEDWIGLVFWAVQRRDPEYLEIMGRYDNSGPHGARPADRFSRAFAELLLHVRRTGREPFGQVFLDNASNAHAGQFFTPAGVCELMAQMMAPQGPCRITDPCCGAGAMLVHTAKAMPAADLERSFFFAQDVDFRCVQMTAVNFWLFGIPGVVVLGDCLALESRRVFQTGRTSAGAGAVREVPVAEAVAAGLVFDREGWLAAGATRRQREDAAQAARAQELKTGQRSLLGMLLGEAS